MSLLLSQLDPWRTFERNVLAIVGIALEMLRGLPELWAKEDMINRKLYQLIIEDAITEWEHRTGNMMPWKPCYEARNQPDPFDEERMPREDKRPEFQWQFRDMKRSMDVNYLDYTIECKRLGSPSSPSWILNRNYITNGVLRFINPDWGYGYLCRSGLMVGYMQSMTSSSILTEVNQYGAEHGVPAIILSEEDWSGSKPNRLDHELNRPGLNPQRFSLRHLWIDVRHHFSSSDEESVSEHASGISPS